MYQFAKTKPLETFTLMSLVLIVLMVLGTGFTISSFFRQAILDREGLIIRDFAQTAAARELYLSDLESFRNPASQKRFENSFAILKNLSEVVRIKVYNLQSRIVWSDYEVLIGKHAPNNPDVLRAIAGQTETEFHEVAGQSRDEVEGLPPIPIVEFYVPLFVKQTGSDTPQIGGVLALYRSGETLNSTLETGNTLVWLFTGLGGGVLYAALFGLFRSLHQRQREAETQFSKLSMEHERIVQLEKLSAVGKMIGEIAHQINNPLVGVLNLAQLAEREGDNPSRVRELLGDIRKAGEHCREFVQRMLTFTKISRSEHRPTDMLELINETITLFQQSTKKHQKIMIELPKTAISINVDPTLIRHALFNLIGNAAEANTGDGVITVRLSPQQRPEDHEPGWLLSVLDQGPGIAKENQDNIFTPFFTTRSEGIGLGLSVVQHIAILHGGTITATNLSEGGSCFALWLPDRERESDGDA